MTKEIYELFRKTLPYVIRDEGTVLRILGNPENTTIAERNPENQLVGVSVIHKNTILLLCVEDAYRSQGIGPGFWNSLSKQLKTQAMMRLWSVSARIILCPVCQPASGMPLRKMSV